MAWRPGLASGFLVPCGSAKNDGQSKFALAEGVWFTVNAPDAVIRRRATRIKIMLNSTEEKAVVEKTRELCDTILAQSGMSDIRRNIDAFMADEKSKSQYDALMAKGQELHEKQHRSLPLSGEEIGEFERAREAVLGNPVARGFMDAQQALHSLQESIQTLVSKSLELGRVPSPEELESHSCGCGHGCGCH